MGQIPRSTELISSSTYIATLVSNEQQQLVYYNGILAIL